MRQLRMISFTSEGTSLGIELSEKLRARGISCCCFAPDRYVSEGKALPLPKDAVQWIGKDWGMFDYLFIGAVGIAIRYTAPWVKDKYHDPAVIGMDERGQYVIPLLSGHIGGAVELSRVIAALLGGTAVITTATDVRGTFAVDVFAKKNNLVIQNRELVKKISAYLLEGGTAGCCSEYPILGKPPQELNMCRKEDLKSYPFAISVQEKCPEDKKENILYLTPKNLAVGIGCRKGTTEEMIFDGLMEMLKQSGYEVRQMECIASIDLKSGEEGLLGLQEKLKVPFLTYSAGELRQTGETASGSEFVKKVTGVDNVCERAAILASGHGRLIVKKTIIGKATYAAAVKNVEMIF